MTNRYERAIRLSHTSGIVENLHWSDLLTEVMASHSDPECAEYNGCDNSPCGWCCAAYLNLQRQGIGFNEEAQSEE